MLITLLMIAGVTVSAQDSASSEKYGNALNAGIGVGYYGYVGSTIPVVHANFEFDVAKNFTLAPFITYFSYKNNYNWGNKNYPNRNYSYRNTVIPIGLKATYYFDKLLHANAKWDFYLGSSLGVSIRKVTWESGYPGDNDIKHGSSGLYFDIHAGATYHFKNNLGLFLDLSSGISTFGLAIQL